ncbi:MAG TPA: hypothetical protein VI457_08990, partial [Methylococcaceae bacterium]|nr:hypothetical protein [Methylococcaceae bacterium]
MIGNRGFARERQQTCRPLEPQAEGNGLHAPFVTHAGWLCAYLPQSARYPCDSLCMKVKDLVALIESDGWVQVRQRGSHR